MGKRALASNAASAAPPVKKQTKESSGARASSSSAAKPERRRLDRRDTEERVDRVIERKLSRFPRELVEASVAADGSTVRETIAAEIRARKSSNEYLRQEFWTMFHSKYKFHEGVGNLLPEPKSKADVSAEVAGIRSLHIFTHSGLGLT